ncbi:MAG: hypothetical protein WBD78_06635, partial [Methylocella sp.]
MKIAELLEAAMEWTVTIGGRDELGEIKQAQLRIEKRFERLNFEADPKSSELSHATLYNMIRRSHTAWHVCKRRGMGGNAREQAGIATIVRS